MDATYKKKNTRQRVCVDKQSASMCYCSKQKKEKGRGASARAESAAPSAPTMPPRAMSRARAGSPRRTATALATAAALLASPFLASAQVSRPLATAADAAAHAARSHFAGRTASLDAEGKISGSMMTG